VALVVVFDPSWDLLQDGQGIRARLDAGIVALEGLYESLADAVAFGASDWREAGMRERAAKRRSLA
jgi:hypothetical protein